MTKKTKIESPLVFDLNGNPGKVQFDTWEDLKVWAEKERDAWKVTQTANYSLDNPWHQIVKNYASVPANLVAVADAVLGANGAADAGIRNQISSTFEQYARGDRLHAETPLGRHIVKLFQVSPQSAANLLAVTSIDLGQKRGNSTDIFSDRWHRARINDAMDGWVRLGLFKTGIKGLEKNIQAALENLRGSFSDEIQRLKAQFLENQAERDAWAETLEKDREDQSTKLQGLFGKTATEVTSFVVSQKEKIRELEDLYNTKILIAAPVNYWSEKRARHYLASVISGGIFVGLSIAIFILGFIYRHELLAALARHNVASWSYPEMLAFVVAPIFLFGWLLRMAYRLFTSNLVLASDASERVTMVQTFLALMSDSQAKIEENDRILILHSLFRPSPTSPGEDGTPPNWFDLLMQRVEKK